MDSNANWKTLRSLQELSDIKYSLRVIAFDCEFVRTTDAATEVGLACAGKAFDSVKGYCNDAPELDDFASRFHVNESSIEIKESYLEQIREIVQRKHSRQRERFLFGKEQYAPLDKIESRMCELKLLGYGEKDHGKYHSHYHNAGNDAVKHLALLHGLLQAGNIERIKLMATIHESTDIRGKRKPTQTLNIFIAEAADGVSQPSILNSALHFAAYITKFSRPGVVATPISALYVRTAAVTSHHSMSTAGDMPRQPPSPSALAVEARTTVRLSNVDFFFVNPIQPVGTYISHRNPAQHADSKSTPAFNVVVDLPIADDNPLADWEESSPAMHQISPESVISVSDELVGRCTEIWCDIVRDTPLEASGGSPDAGNNHDPYQVNTQLRSSKMSEK
ncbi:Uu.00g054940.m01.CDS01 [Anthostomella pinea]|uniref:Uu.00g054940.m01.CDS01 n=1 Tax=Anthostomella pinea TaxID=933095 RepID=A0AAI8VXE9_9PEZI|nr:Uu.00g054940.m01.CDS01 [Anthostomella pinea]